MPIDYLNYIGDNYTEDPCTHPHQQINVEFLVRQNTIAEAVNLYAMDYINHPLHLHVITILIIAIIAIINSNEILTPII